MPEFLGPVKGFGVTFRQMFRKVDTVQYPEEKRPTAPRFHGRHQLNRWPDGLEKCIGCELCAWACPADAIYVEGADNTAEERYSPGERYGAVSAPAAPATAGAEAGTGGSAAFPVPPLDLPHYHGVGVTASPGGTPSDPDAAARAGVKEVTGA